MTVATARFLALGDSYTIGEDVPLAQGWPAQVCQRLQEHGFTIAPAHIVATTGWTTDELAAAMDAAALTPGFDLVSLQIGVNDQYRGRPLATLQEGFRHLLQRAIELAEGRAARVVVVSIPDWGVTPFARAHDADCARIAAEIDACNALIASTCAAHAVAMVDVTAISRGGGRDLLAADGLHPSAEQYALWSVAIAVAAARALSG
ncbi:MAG: SGNH/GDSL hydrolase family protein [Dokdonella sp.]